MYAVATTSERAVPDPQAVLDDLVRCETRLYNALNDHLRARHGITTSQYELLRHLRAHPGARVGDLAAVFAIGVGAASKGVDRLERAGWLSRRPDPQDRRSSLLVLTEQGARLAEAAAHSVTERAGELLAALNPDQTSATAQALSVLRAALEREGIGTPAG